MSKESLRTESGIGDVRWVMGLTDWTHDKVARLCRLRRIKGAFQAQPGIRGSMWCFRKARTLAWLESLETRRMLAQIEGEDRLLELMGKHSRAYEDGRNSILMQRNRYQREWRRKRKEMQSNGNGDLQ